MIVLVKNITAIRSPTRLDMHYGITSSVSNVIKSLDPLEKAIAWSKRITDLHENLSPNSKLAKEMDLHNNKIGRDLFAENHKIQLDHVEKLRKMTRNAVKISSVEDIKAAKNELVYIED